LLAVSFLSSLFLISKATPTLLNELFSGRLQVWKLAWVKFLHNPVFGQGLGVVKTWEIVIRDTKCLVLHNDWYEKMVEIGVVGLVLMALVVINSIRRFKIDSTDRLKSAYLVSFISFLVLMLGSFPIEIAPLALLGLAGFWAVETL
jgi:O-antigen ligase